MRDNASNEYLNTNLTPRDLTIALAVVTVWGFTFVPIRWALDEVPPFAMATVRSLLVAIPAVFIVPRPRMRWLDIVAYGFFLGVCQFALLLFGMKLGMPAGLSSLVIQSQVFFTIALAFLFLDDRLHRWNIVGGSMALLGIALLAVYRFDGETTTTMAGFALVIASALVWGIGNLIAKRAAGANMFALVVWSCVVPPLPFALLSLVFEGASTSVRALTSASWVTWASIAYLSFGAMLFGFARWNILLQHYPTALIAPFALLVPVVGLASGAIILGERLAVIQFVGVMFVLTGLAVNVYGVRWFRSNNSD